MPGIEAWRPGRQKERFVNRHLNGGDDDERIVIKVRFNQLAWNECIRITTNR